MHYDIYAQVMMWFLSALTMLYIWMMGNKTVWGPILSAIAQIAWTVFCVYTHQWGLIPGNVAIFVVCVRNCIKWSKESKKTCYDSSVYDTDEECLDVEAFRREMYKQQYQSHSLAKRKGFWSEDDAYAYHTMGNKFMLMVTELSEAMEAARHRNPESEKIPGYSQIEEELADCVIRIMDFCGALGYRLPDAILEKHKYNVTRPHKHGKTC